MIRMVPFDSANITKHLTLLIFVSPFLFPPAGFANFNPWSDFVKNPGQITYEICRQQVIESLSAKGDYSSSTTVRELLEGHLIGRLLRLVEEGNAYAGHLVFQLYPLFTGYPDLTETFGISLGKLIKKDPELFLSLLERYLPRDKSRKYVMGGILANYGDNFVDESEKQVQETQERIAALRKVREANLEKIRDECVDLLKRHKASIMGSTTSEGRP
jgi:hypothetical protein